MELKRIVAGCSGTPEGRDAIALAGIVAAATGAGLSLVGVYPTSLFPIPGTSDRRTLRGQAEGILHRERDLLAPDALVEPVADISVPRALRHYAEHWHAGLVVVGSDAAARDGRAAVSSRSRQLLYDAPFSVTIAQRGFHTRASGLRSIAVGYDGGPESQSALELAERLARATGASLRLHSVIDDWIPALTVEHSIVVEDWAEMWEAERKAALSRARDAAPEGAQASASIGDPGSELRALSDSVDLIVVGSRRWGPFARLLVGGAGETLVSDAGCSVLVARRPPASHDRKAPPGVAQQTAA